MLIIGSHVSFNKQSQLLGSLEEALSYGANTFMFYTGAPQNTVRYDIDNKLTEKALEKMKDNNININNIIVHAPYIVNLANNKEDSIYERCLYGKPVSEYMINYTMEFWNTYFDNKNFRNHMLL